MENYLFDIDGETIIDSNIEYNIEGNKITCNIILQGGDDILSQSHKYLGQEYIRNHTNLSVPEDKFIEKSYSGVVKCDDIEKGKKLAFNMAIKNYYKDIEIFHNSLIKEIRDYVKIINKHQLAIDKWYEEIINA